MKKITISYVSQERQPRTREFLAADVAVLSADERGMRTKFIFKGCTTLSFECANLESVEITEIPGE